MSVTISYKPSACRMLHGTWTHTVGTAEETLTVMGVVYDGKITCVDDATKAINVDYQISYSTTTGRSTITFNYTGDVTDGRFIFWVSSM